MLADELKATADQQNKTVGEAIAKRIYGHLIDDLKRVASRGEYSLQLDYGNKNYTELYASTTVKDEVRVNIIEELQRLLSKDGLSIENIVTDSFGSTVYRVDFSKGAKKAKADK